jgi:hypothetical protein
MPSKSAKQHKFMEAVAHSSTFASKVGVPRSVGQDFARADEATSKNKSKKASTKGRPNINKHKHW